MDPGSIQLPIKAIRCEGHEGCDSGNNSSIHLRGDCSIAWSPSGDTNGLRGESQSAEVVPEYLNMLPTKQNFTLAYHPRTNATAERWNRTFQNVLTEYIGGTICGSICASSTVCLQGEDTSNCQISSLPSHLRSGPETARVGTPEKRDLRAEIQSDDLYRMMRQREAVRVSTEAS